MERREFLKYGLSGMATVFVGSHLPWLQKTAGAADVAPLPPQTLTITITDALKDMATHNSINQAQCYFWIYDMSLNGVPIPSECPGPTLVVTAGDTVNFSITNALDEPHSLFIPGIVDTGAIAPGDTFTGLFTATAAGAFLYFDNLNAPVNRMMGLHGALVVMPATPAVGATKFTPYDNPTPAIQQLFDDFGPSEHFPGLAWEEGDATPWALDPTKANVTPFRQFVWLLHQASPNLFAEVGSLAPGVLYDPQAFMDAFLRDPFQPNQDNNRNPQYFTINGQSGFFSHFNPVVTPMTRVGEPVVIHILNAGLWSHSMHLHSNHFFVTSINDVPQENLLWIDVFGVYPMDKVDYVVPAMRPPDIGTIRGIGRPETPLTTINGHPVWPPIEEFEMHMPELGTTAQDIDGNPVELGQRMSPLCYPMHDHTEPSQTAQGGNYNMGLISGLYITGDRNTPGFMDFPIDEDFLMAFQNIRGTVATAAAAPAIGVPVTPTPDM